MKIGHFEDERPSLPPRKPQGVKPMGKTHKLVAKGISTAVAILLWTGIKHTLEETKGHNISSMQLQAGERGNPMVIDTTPNNVSTQIVGVITGKPEPKSTLIINPPGQEPAIKVVTPEVTITANKVGEVKTIVPKENTQEKPLTEIEAKRTVDEAVRDAANSTLPKEESPKPPLTPEEKK